jgi:predicted molibdopterin-dependent oxidoreductase YjgC
MDTLQRVNARLNEDVNEEWTCDRGKFGHDYVSSPDRLKTPMIRRGDTFEPIDWAEANRILKEQLIAAGSKVGGIGGSVSTNEDNYAFQKLFRESLGSGNLDHRLTGFVGPSGAPMVERLGYSGMGNSIADLENMKTILVLGSDLSAEQPIIFLRVRKAYRFKGASVIHADTRTYDETTSVNDFAEVNLMYRPGTEIALLNGLLNAMLTQKLAAVPAGLDAASLTASLTEWTPARTAQETGTTEADISAAAKLLARGPMAIIAGKSVREHPHYADIVNLLSNLVIVTGNPGNLNIPGDDCNSQGAADMGLLPDRGPGHATVQTPGLNTVEMLQAAADGRLKALWLHETELLDSSLDQNLVRRALENCPFIVATALTLSPTTQSAHLVLPVSSFAEKDGTFTSCERRVQRIYKAFDISPDVKPGWLVFTETAAVLGKGRSPYFSARDILRDIAARVPLYAGITPKSLGEGGVRWNYPEGSAPALKLVPVTYRAPERAAVTV